jgi:2-oxoisovalerate dehydrogenase E1 component
MAQLTMLIRCFEQTLLDLQDKDCVYGPVHTSIGQEAVAVGAALALRKSDHIFATHRAHHHYLAKTLAAIAPQGFDPLKSDFTDEMKDTVRVLLCEVMGLAEGCSGGRGGSMHLYNPEFGVAGTNAIVGGGVPHATGYAWADRRQGRDAVTVCFYGDGAVYQGVVHESLNLGSLWKAPVIYFVENNLYAVATSVRDGCSAKRLADVAGAYGLPAIRLDGMDALAVMRGVEKAIGKRDESTLPCMIEAIVYRYLHHAGNAPGSGFGYRTKEEEADWKGRDAIECCVGRLRQLKAADEAGIRQLEQQAAECVDEAVRYCTETHSTDQIVVREALWPKPESALAGVRGADLPLSTRFVEAEDVQCKREVRYSDAIAQVTGRWFEKEPTAFLLGEEVANFGGGPYGATKGLLPAYRDRILNTPISESGFCGLALGAALNGMRPIVEIMFTSFALVASDQLFNQIAQIRHIYGGKPEVPLVARTRLGAGLGYGAQHSLDPIAILSLFPGWRIFVPTTPFDYIGLFNAAMQLRSPVFLVEHNRFYADKGMVPESDLDYLVRPGKAKIRRVGSDVTVVSYGYGVTQALEAAKQISGDGIEAEVIDLRTVDDWSLDYGTIGLSLEKTGMLVTVEQAPAANSIGAKIARGCAERFFDSLDGEPVTLNSLDAPLPVSRRLEQACLISTDRIAGAIRKAAGRQR